MVENLAACFRMRMLVLINIQDGRPAFITAGAYKSYQYFYLIFYKYTERGSAGCVQIEVICISSILLCRKYWI